MIVSINVPSFSVDLSLGLVAFISHCRLSYIIIWDMK